MIKSSLTLNIDGTSVAATVEADYHNVKATMTSPVSGPSKGRYQGGVAFGMVASKRPELYFVANGKISDKGWKNAKQLLTDLYLDWQAISNENKPQVDEQLVETNRQLESVRLKFLEKEKPFLTERTELRRRFKCGELSQSEYQTRVKYNRKALFDIKWKEEQAESKVCEDFRKWMAATVGRGVQYWEALRIRKESPS